MRRHLVPVVLLVGLCSTWAAAAPAPAPNIIVDEWGNSLGPIAVHAVLPTTPGAPLMYTLPFPVIPGDVVLLENPQATISDLIRFPVDPNTGGLSNVMLFYSDVEKEAEIAPPADVGIPEIGPVVVRLFEVGDEGNNGAIYTPLGDQPGALPGTVFPTYQFISDSVVPLPTSIGLGAAGFGLMGVLRVIRRLRAA